MKRLTDDQRHYWIKLNLPDSSTVYERKIWNDEEHQLTFEDLLFKRDIQFNQTLLKKII